MLVNTGPEGVAPTLLWFACRARYFCNTIRSWIYWWLINICVIMSWIPGKKKHWLTKSPTRYIVLHTISFDIQGIWKDSLLLTWILTLKIGAQKTRLDNPESWLMRYWINEVLFYKQSIFAISLSCSLVYFNAKQDLCRSLYPPPTYAR